MIGIGVSCSAGHWADALMILPSSSSSSISQASKQPVVGGMQCVPQSTQTLVSPSCALPTCHVSVLSFNGQLQRGDAIIITAGMNVVMRMMMLATGSRDRIPTSCVC